ncbi:hypothetical protein CNR27_05510 [Luteimonas chenhongjianii]|uniref:Nucleotidyltransferase n=1 Tax=Luteimonas chenhongjianii TaxID=2006110 RepID=A0A290XDF2_9GAMM|nr:hypothetical protein [Luteimonas chenhongjianii]ATD66966.1 hypothetical protein CNR27_05510 [Luteimonas chenhongjianii]
MHRARQHSDSRNRERRNRLAQEAARLMAEGGIHDIHQAKLKAADRLGIHDEAALPRDGEIEVALREYQRLFSGTRQIDALRVRREAAERAMAFLAAFSPRLVGPVLEGTADAHSAVTLHVHTDDPGALVRFIEEHGIPAEGRMRRVRLDRQRTVDVDVWLFAAEDLTFDLTVLPEASLRQAPLSSGDDRPMRRMSHPQLRKLLTQEYGAPEAR